MDFKSLLSQLDQLNEATEKTKTGLKHTAEPGGYGRKDDEDDEGKKVKADAPKRGRGRPKKDAGEDGEKKSYDTKSLGDVFGGGKKPKKEVGKVSKKHSLKEYFDSMDKALNEMMAQQPIPVVGKAGQTQQTGAGFLNIDDNSPAGQAMKDAIGKLAQQKKAQIVVPTQQQKPGQPAQTTQQQSQQTMAEDDMDESGEKWIQKAVKHPGAFTKKAEKAGKSVAAFAKEKAHAPGTLGKQARLAQTLRKISKTNEADMPPNDSLMSPISEQDVTEDQLNELSPELLQRYQDQARNQRSLANQRAYPKDYPDSEYIHGNKEPSPAEFDKLTALASKRLKGSQIADYKLGNRSRYHYDGSDSREGRITARLDAKKAAAQDAAQDQTQQPNQSYDYDGFDSDRNSIKFGRTYNESKAKPDFLDLDKDGNKKESMKKAAQDKKKVDEGMNHKLQSARLAGKAHALAKEGYNCRYDDMEEARHYHEGYKEGLDECYGQMPIQGYVGEEASAGSAASKFNPSMHDRIKNASKEDLSSIATNLAGDGFGSSDRWDDEYKLLVQAQRELLGSAQAQNQLWATHRSQGIQNRLNKTLKTKYPNIKVAEEDMPATVPGMASQADGLDEMDRSEWMKHKAKVTPGDKFNAFGQTIADKEVLESPFAFEAWDKELNALLESKEEVTEGMTVSISKGQQGAPDSVSVSAQDAEADQLLSLIKHAGLGLFGGDEAPQQAQPMTVDTGEPAEVGTGGVEIGVVDDHDGMMNLIKKVTGAEPKGPEGGFADQGGEEDGQDYEEEGGHDHEDTCEGCGMEESACSCEHEETVDEDETMDQREEEVAEDQTEEEETSADENAEAAEDEASANYDRGEQEAEGASYKAAAEEEKDLDESYANGADDTFETDINFMTKVISGGLNKQKSTGQTTQPVIAGQNDRMGYNGATNESVNDWKKLAGIK